MVKAKSRIFIITYNFLTLNDLKKRVSSVEQATLQVVVAVVNAASVVDGVVVVVVVAATVASIPNASIGIDSCYLV